MAGLIEVADNESHEQFVKWGIGYDIENDPAETTVNRGMNKDYEWDEKADKPDPGGKVLEDSEGSKLYKEFYSGKYPRSLIGKIHALTIDPPKLFNGYVTGHDGSDYSKYNKDAGGYHKIIKFSHLCEPSNFSDEIRQRADMEYYAEDFLYSGNSGYPLNRLITLRRFPYACIDNISDPLVQPERDVTRMVTFFDDQTNKLEDILGFSYGLRWKQLESEMESMRMYGGDQEGLTGFIKTGALAMGDKELIRNRLRGPVGNEVDPKADSNKVYGPVDSITSTHLRDVGFDFDKEFSLVFTYKSRSYGGRNPDVVMKDVLANILLCTFNDGEFWPGSRFWIGARPSKVTNKLKWMNSDNPNKILEGAYESLKYLIQEKFNNKATALETLKSIISGGLQMVMAKLLNTMGRPGIIYSNSLLSNEPVGLWHLTIGHPLNPILTMGDLLCSGVDISFPDDTLSYGDFPTTIKAVVKLKPAKPRDRAGIEMMFNHGRKRIYMPAVVKVDKNPALTSTRRGYWDQFKKVSLGYVDVVHQKGKDAANVVSTFATDQYHQLKYSVSAGIKYAQNEWNDTTVWINNKENWKDAPIKKDIIEIQDNIVDKTSQAYTSSTEFIKDTYNKVVTGTNDLYNQASEK